jgi:hypothetical protein
VDVGSRLRRQKRKEWRIGGDRGVAVRVTVVAWESMDRKHN